MRKNKEKIAEQINFIDEVLDTSFNTKYIKKVDDIQDRQHRRREIAQLQKIREQYAKL